MRKHVLLWVFIALVAVSPAAADNSFGVFGAYHNTEDVDESSGAGIRTRLGWLDLRASWLNDLTRDTSPESLDFELQAVPLEAGVAFDFMTDARWNPYVGGGVSYFLLDSDDVEIKDQAGFYGVLGSEFGFRENLNFMVEAMYRNMEAEVERDPNKVRDVNNIDLERESNVELGGFGINAGVSWRF
jgi:hypothetical protein